MQLSIRPAAVAKIASWDILHYDSPAAKRQPALHNTEYMLISIKCKKLGLFHCFMLSVHLHLIGPRQTATPKLVLLQYEYYLQVYKIKKCESR